MKVKDSVILGGMFLFLLVFYILQQTVFKPDESSFRTELTHFDPDSVDRITLKIADQETVLVQEAKRWKIVQNERLLPAREALIDSLLKDLSHLSTILLVTRDSLQWAEYGVDAGQGKLFSFYMGKNQVGQVVLGDAGLNKESGDRFAYGRLPDENETYSLHPYPALFSNFDNYTFLPQKLWSFDPAEIETLLLISGEQEEVIRKKPDGEWYYGAIPIDSIYMRDYLTKLAHLSGKDFLDSFDTAQGFGVIQSLRLNDKLEIDCYLDENGFVLKSNENDAFFSSDSTGLYEDVFIDLEDLLIHAAQKKAAME
jgi:hypothetical protein